MKENLLHSEITEDIIKAFYQVYNTLGYGFLEKVYENSLVVVLRKMGHMVLQQHPISVYFENQIVGEYFADLLVDGKVIIELKAVVSLDEAHEAQLVNYLKATKVEVGMLLNFGKKPEFKRKLFTNNAK
ncbi:MAG TPA: GxxExxY protein [Bacteroidota bacterium]